jgi:uncharacterized protein YggU (UPF0235/DUF167 family)
MKPKKHPAEAAANAAILEAINKATGAKQVRHGPEPKRFKIDGYADWKDAVKVALRKPRPAKGWPK